MLFKKKKKKKKRKKTITKKIHRFKIHCPLKLSRRALLGCRLASLCLRDVVRWQSLISTYSGLPITRTFKANQELEENGRE